MSTVTNLILHFSLNENEVERLKDVNSFRYLEREINLVSIDYNKNTENGYSWYGGTKFFEASLFLGAFNHLDLPAFVDHLRQIKWEARDCVQLIVKEQGDAKFRIIELD